MSAQDREAMVREQIIARGIRDERLLEAMRAVPRDRFLPGVVGVQAFGYADSALPIGEGQTISQPYIVAVMTECLALTGSETVLEIGAGSGYQTAILSRVARQVIAIERIPALAERAERILKELGTENVRLIVGDGSRGWSEGAPYDAILVAAVAPSVPPALIQQLKRGGRLVLPVGPEDGLQRLLLLTKAADGTESVTTRDLGQVAFVPLVGAHGYGLPEDLGTGDI